MSDEVEAAVPSRGGGELAIFDAQVFGRRLRLPSRLPSSRRRLVLLGEADRLADALAEVEELGPAGLAAARTTTFAMNGECSGKMRSTPSLFTMRRTVKVSLIPRPFCMITVPEKTWMRSLSPSTMRVCTSTVSPTSNCGTSCLEVGLLDVFDDFVGHGTLRSAGKYQSLISNFIFGLFVLQVRLPQVRPALLRSFLSLLQPPLGDRRVVAAEQDVRDAHPAKLPRAGVLRILEQPVGERLVGRAVFGAQGTRAAAGRPRRSRPSPPTRRR